MDKTLLSVSTYLEYPFKKFRIFFRNTGIRNAKESPECDDSCRTLR